jgi:hypothetical protein
LLLGGTAPVDPAPYATGRLGISNRH